MGKKQVIGVSITILLGVGFLVYWKMKSKKPKEDAKTVIPEPTVTPKPKKRRDVVPFKRDKDMTRREYIDKYY
tara:strand:- start:6340 stop:6558 length:219 start_codon:yes stop_codon:yes gene_type:complete